VIACLSLQLDKLGGTHKSLTLQMTLQFLCSHIYSPMLVVETMKLCRGVFASVGPCMSTHVFTCFHKSAQKHNHTHLIHMWFQGILQNCSAGKTGVED